MGKYRPVETHLSDNSSNTNLINISIHQLKNDFGAKNKRFKNVNQIRNENLMPKDTIPHERIAYKNR